VKSAARNIHATELAALLERLETAAKKRDEILVQAELTETVAEFTRVLEYLESQGVGEPSARGA
jgi:hypothetical protein